MISFLDGKCKYLVPSLQCIVRMSIGESSLTILGSEIIPASLRSLKFVCLYTTLFSPYDALTYVIVDI